jgi:hypothetical protein
LIDAELAVGKAVGQGGFSLVCKLDDVTLNPVFDISEQSAKLRSDFVASVPNHQYVIKTLRPDLPEEEYVKGIVDLAIEAEFLSILSHPNIISMKAMANSDPHESNFFVILDRLVVTLDRKFNQWRRDVGDVRHSSDFLFGFILWHDSHMFCTPFTLRILDIGWDRLDIVVQSRIFCSKLGWNGCQHPETLPMPWTTFTTNRLYIAISNPTILDSMRLEP